MSNIFYNGAEVWMSSGQAGTSYAMVPRCQSVNIGYQIPRTNVPIIGRMKPLNNRPVVNYTPSTVSVEYVKGDKNVETMLGILNSTGIAVNLGAGTSLNNYGARNIQVMLAPNTSPNYAGQYNLMTGVLNSFSMGGSVTEPVKAGFSMEFLDVQQAPNNNARTIPDYGAQLVKSENTTITGIDFTGLGYSGIIIQSFKFDVNFNRTSTIRLGEKYPDRRVTEANATLALNGFLEGSTNTVTSLTGYDCGAPIPGVYSLSLLPSCSTESPTVINITNPYLESVSLGSQVGNYISVDLQFSCPLSYVPSEAALGSNVTIT